MRRRGCRRSGWSRPWYWLVVSVLVLGGPSGAVPLSAQSTTTPPPIEPPPGYVLIPTDQWERLTTLSIALEMRLTGRVEQVTTLQTQLDESTRHNAELQRSQARLRTELAAISTSLVSSEDSLRKERSARQLEREGLTMQIVTARDQRDVEAERANAAERRADRNRLVWQIGIPVIGILGVIAGSQL